jgi:hypothetical protein
MKKYILFYSTLFMAAFIFASLCNAMETNMKLLQDRDDGVSFEIALPFFEFTEIEGYQFKKVSADGFGTVRKSGAPGVIAKAVLIEVPSECEIDVQAHSLVRTRLENIFLAPSPTRILVEDEQGEMRIAEQFEIDKKAYSTDALFPGRLAKVEFTGYLRDRRVAKIDVFPVQYNPVTKELVIHKKLRINITFNNQSKTRAIDSNVITPEKRLSKNNTFEEIYKSSLLNYKPDRAYGTVKPLHKKSLNFNTLAAEINESPFAVKIVTEGEGIYKITYDDLSRLGIDLLTATSENLKMSNQGQEIAIYCSGTGQFTSGDYIIFYGESFKSLYSEKNVYWLYLGEQSGKRMSEIDGNIKSGYPVQTVFKNTYHAEEEKEYWQNIPPYKEGIDHWFWTELNISKDNATSADYPVYLNNFVKTAGSYSMKINMTGETDTGQDPDHHTRVYINGNVVDDFTWNGQVELIQVTDDISPSFFVEGENTITVEAVDDTGARVDSYYLNWFEIEYWDSFVAESDYLKFSIEETGGVAIQVEGFTESELWAFDITDPVNVYRITNASITQNGSSYTMKFEDKVYGSKTYCTVSRKSFSTPADMVVYETSDLSTARDSVDYIIITHENFYDGIQRLKSYRESRGLKVEVAKIQGIYDEFSYGIKDAEAIKDFLTYAYNNWHKTDHPTYVLLVGDASLDYRDKFGYYAQGKEDFVPTYIFQTYPIGDTPTDNWFVCVDGQDYLPEMAIGRLCVKTEDDLSNIIDKIKKYEGEKLSAWCGNVILAADDETTFESISDSLANMLPDGFNPKKVYISQYEDISSATDDLIKKINDGAVITNYTGHGHIDEWAAPFLFYTPGRKGQERNDVDRLTNNDRLTFVIVLNCMSGFFSHWTDDYSLAEELVRAEDKGAIACIASTAAGYPSEHQVLAKKIFNGFF